MSGATCSASRFAGQAEKLLDREPWIPGEQFFVADAHRDGQRFIVHADES
jgi:hypothetical protein